MQEFFFAQKAFILHKREVLLVRKSMDDPNQPSKWEVPGGRMDFGEDVDSHIIREVKEEVGLDIRPGRPFSIWQWQFTRQGAAGEHIDIQIVAVARLCTTSSTETSTTSRVESDCLAECRWVPVNEMLSYDIIRHMIPVAQVFLQEMTATEGSRL